MHEAARRAAVKGDSVDRFRDPDRAPVRNRRSAASRGILASSPTTVESPPLPPLVLFADDFSASTVFQSADEGAYETATGNGQHRLRFNRRVDAYLSLPELAPAHATIQQTRNLSVAVEARNASGEATNLFGILCRFHGIDHDVYLAALSADGSWSIYRATLGGGSGQPYVKRALASGRTPELEGLQSSQYIFRIRLDCSGQAPTTLKLFLNEREVGAATDPTGLDPGNVGMFATSTNGTLIFDNLVVTQLP